MKIFTTFLISVSVILILFTSCAEKSQKSPAENTSSLSESTNSPVESSNSIESSNSVESSNPVESAGSPVESSNSVESSSQVDEPTGIMDRIEQAIRNSLNR